uniref:Uncharacterized protein n=1 Tax=Amphilophus citrinellus TaxID=61819 RepID=A0A3Q0SV40_AMPCI
KINVTVSSFINNKQIFLTAKDFGNANQESVNLSMQQLQGQIGPHFLPHIWSV